MYDFLIVGSGFFGSSFARKATDSGMKCLVVEKKDHIAGAAHDTKHDDYYVSSYGAHIFHTHSEEVWNFVNQFEKFTPFVNRPKVLSGGVMYSFPINLMTLHQMWGVKTPSEASRKLDEVRVKIDKPSNFEEWALSMVGEEIYRKFFYGYTKKQYMREPRELPASIIQRIPIRLTYDENYFTTKHQGVPQNGYTNLITKMLDGIDVDTKVDFIKERERLSSMCKYVVYTGPVDEFFGFEFGKLEYNTLRFTKEVHPGDFQGNAVVNYADDSVPHIRSIEHRHFYRHGESVKHYDAASQNRESVVTYDIPVPYRDNPDPFYPIRDKANSEMYQKYKSIKPSNVIFGGRLGEYKYLDMDQSVASAIQKFKDFTESKRDPQA